MIVHTAVDARYCTEFAPVFVENTRQFMANALVSLALVDRDFDLHGVSVDIVQHDPLSFEDIKIKFAISNNEDAMAYYGLSRFVWLPVTDHDVMVRDVDTLAVCDIDIAYLTDMLENYDVVNLVRKKHNNTTGGLGAIVFSQRVCDQIRQFAQKLCQQKTLYWPIDEEIKHYCQQQLNYVEIERYGNMDSFNPNCNLDHAWIVHTEKTFVNFSDLAVALKKRSFEKIKRLYQDNPQ